MVELSARHTAFAASGWQEADDRFLIWPEVRHQTGVSRTTAWRMERDGVFPARVQLSPGRVGWRESEVAAWKMSRRLARLAATARKRGGVPRPDISEPEQRSDLPTKSVPRPLEHRRDEVPLMPAESAADNSEAPATIEGPAAMVRCRAKRRTAVSPDQMGFDF